MKRTRSLLTALILAGCATAPSVQDGHAQVEVDSHLLLADIALDRQDRDTAMREFLAAAMLSEEPGPAERATRIAHELELTEQGLTAGARWRELAPDDERPAWYLGVFETRANRVPRAITEFTTFMRSIDDRRTGFVLVLEALGDEPYTGTATTIMRSLNETFPNVPAGQYALARLALRSGDFELALENAEAASQSNADWIEAQLLYARTLLVTGRTEDSLAIAADLAGRHDELEVQLQYAELLLSAGRPREAETRLNEILADEPGVARSHSRAGVPCDDGAAHRRREALLQRSARRVELSQRGVLLLGKARRDGARFLAGDTLVCARHGRHARRRGATAHGADHVRGAERPRKRGAPSERLRRRESAFRDGHARGAGAAVAADGATGGSDARARRGARVDARRSGAAHRSCAALRDSGAKRRRARRARGRRGAARRRPRSLPRQQRRCATRWRCSTRTRTATARPSTCSSLSPRITPTTRRY